MVQDDLSLSSPEIPVDEPTGTYPLASTAHAHVQADPSSNERGLEPVAPLAEPSADRLPVDVGATLKHYELLRKLGQGGMGTVFLARDTKLGRLVAIKLLLEYSGPKAGRFLAEARATARCRHDNIVVIHEVDAVRGYPYMVLEYLKGRTLRAWMAQRERPSGPESIGAADTLPSAASIIQTVESP
jgi:serine/threonine protein kinase